MEEVIDEDTVLKNLSHHGKKEFKTEERGVMGSYKGSSVNTVRAKYFD